MSTLGWTLWYTSWIFFSCLVGLGVAVLGLGHLFAFLCVTLFTFLFFVSTVSLHYLLRTANEAPEQAD